MLPIDWLADTMLCFNRFTAIKLASGDYVMLQYFTAIKGAITLVILGWVSIGNSIVLSRLSSVF